MENISLRTRCIREIVYILRCSSSSSYFLSFFFFFWTGTIKKRDKFDMVLVFVCVHVSRAVSLFYRWELELFSKCHILPRDP